MAEKLSEAAEVACEWGSRNGVTFDHGKSEAMLQPKKKGRNALARLRRLAGQMGLSPANSRKVMAACMQLVAMYRNELW